MKAMIEKTVSITTSLETLSKALGLPSGFTLSRMEAGLGKLELAGLSQVVVIGKLVTEEELASPPPEQPVRMPQMPQMPQTPQSERV